MAPTRTDAAAPSTWTGIALAIAAMVGIQGGNAVGVHLIRIGGTVDAIALRLTFSSVLLVLTLRPDIPRLIHDQGPARLLGFGTAVAVMSGSIYGAITRLPLSMAVTIGLLGPLTVAAASSRRRTDYLWPLLALTGVVLMAGKRLDQGTLNWLGIMFALLNAGSWGSYIVLSAKTGDQTGNIDALAVASTIAAGLWIAVALIKGGTTQMVHLHALGLGCAAGTLSTGMPYMFENLALRHLPRRVFATLASLEPAVAATIGALFLSQPPTAYVLGGVVCAVVATLGAALR